MKKLSCEEMSSVRGGGIITSAFINAVSKAVNVIYSLGQAVGSAIARAKSGKFCPVA